MELETESEKKGSMSDVGGGIKTRSCGAERAVMNMDRTSEFILRARGSHWRILSKKERELISLIF